MLKPNNNAYLKLNYNYYLFEKFNRKLFSQKYDPFLVKCRIEQLMYKLELLLIRRVHSIILVIQLKSILSANANSYYRSRLDYSNEIETDNNIS